MDIHLLLQNETACGEPWKFEEDMLLESVSYNLADITCSKCRNSKQFKIEELLNRMNLHRLHTLLTKAKGSP